MERAVQDYDEAIKLEPNTALFYSNRGKAKLKMGDKGGSDADFRKARSLDRSADISSSLLGALFGLR